VERLARLREDRLAVIVVLQWLHVLFAIFWFGSQLYSVMVVDPQLARLVPADAYANIVDAFRAGTPRLLTVVSSTGTVLLGFLRGLAGGVLDVAGSAYFYTWLTALVIGAFMVISIWTRGYGGRMPSPVWNSLFVVMFTLMIAMRFGY